MSSASSTPDLHEVVLRGDARVYDDEGAAVSAPRRARLGGKRVHHVGQRLRVGGVAGKDGGVADEPGLVDAQGKNQQAAVGALLLRAPELRLGASWFLPLKEKIGEVKNRNRVVEREQVVGLVAQVLLQPVFQGIQTRCHVIDPAKGRPPVLAARQQLADGGVVLHDAHGLQLRRAVDRADYEVGKGCVNLHLAPSLAGEEAVKFQLAQRLEANPLGTHLAGIRVLHGVDIDEAAGLLAGGLDVLLDGIYAAAVHHRTPELGGLPADKVVVAGKRVFEQVPLALVLVKVGQALANVAYVLRPVVLVDETHVQHHTAADTACQVAVRLLDAVIPFITPGLRVVSELGHEVHRSAKVKHCFHSPLYSN